MTKWLNFLIIQIGVCTTALAQLQSFYIQKDFLPDANAAKAVWNHAFDQVAILADWRARLEYPYLETRVKSLWSDTHLYLLYTVPFDSITTDDSIQPDLNGDSWAIWNNDVVELFIGDNPDIKRYFEFVVSPLNQKIDIAHNKNLPKEKSFDTSYTSGWKTSVAQDKNKRLWIAELRIPLKAISTSDVKEGKTLRFNLFRCHRNDAGRIYMAMNATGTPTPNFHVPEKFGTLELVKSTPMGDPALYLDFETDKTKNAFAAKTVSAMIFPEKSTSEAVVHKAGVAGSDCIDFTNVTAENLLCYSDPALLDSIDGMRSFTVTGWFKSKVNYNDLESKFLLGCPERFRLAVHGVYKGRMGVDLLTSEKKNSGVWSNWFGPFLSEERWVFFAFTYDSTRDVNNALICVGTEEYEVESEAASVNAWPLGSKASKPLFIGNCIKRDSNIFRGKLDNIRIFADKTGSRGALNRQQIESLRKLDVGPEYLAKLRRQRQQREFLEQQKLQNARLTYWDKPFNAILVDSLDRVFPDMPPAPSAFREPISAPRGSRISFQIAIGTKTDAQVDIGPVKISSASDEVFAGSTSVFSLLFVPVEANNNGGIRTSITSRPPAMWLEKAIRKAPFEVAEVLVPADSLKIRASEFSAILVDVNVPVNTRPGRYKGVVKLSLKESNESVLVPFEFIVHDTILQPDLALHSVHWLWPEPENLVYGKNVPQWWSQQHWELLKLTGLQLRAYGQDTMYTPIIGGTYPLIKTIRKSDGTISFDFSLFDKWIELFSGQGFVEFDGHQIAGGHHVRPMTVVAVDEQTGKKFDLFTKDSDPNSWFEFIPVFYKQLYSHLKAKGWTDRYRQCQLDEPGDYANYKKLAELARTYMPGVLTKDAINGNPEKYSPLVDIQVFGISTLAAGKHIADERKLNGKATWLYHCASPYPPNPNRHLDDPLSMSRLYPWYAYLFDAQGYLNWAANIYRGADPYKTSIGPLPGGSQNPGHPPGDNWFFYPGPDGLRSSMRMVAFREGLIDHNLLIMLSKKDKAAADKIMNSIARTLIDYQRDNVSYHQARKQMLTLLDGLK